MRDVIGFGRALELNEFRVRGFYSVMLATMTLSTFFLVSAGQELPGYDVDLEILSATVRRIAESPAPTDRAWAAHLVGKHSLQNEVDLLLELISSHSGDRRDVSTWVDMAALDSLIQLDASPPAELLMPLYSKFPKQVIILLARNAEQNQDWLHMLLDEPMDDAPWLALNNLLAESRAPGLAARLLRELVVKVLVGVSDDGRRIGGSGDGSSSLGCGAFAISRPAFPPWVRYQLIKQPVRGAIVIAPGPRPIYFQRLLSGDAGHPSGRTTTNRHDRYRLEILASLLNTTVEFLGYRDRQFRSIQWKGAAAFVKESEAFRSEIERSFEILVGKLLNADLLSLHEAQSLRPNLEWMIVDYRERSSVPLPAIEAAGP